MTLVMYDGPVANLPPGADAYAGYISHSGIGTTYPAILTIPAHYHLSITTDPLYTPSQVMCADVETGAMTSWAGYTVGYASVARIPSLVSTTGRPHRLWSAHYTGIPHICGPHSCGALPYTADGTQWTTHTDTYDESLLSTDFFDFLNTLTNTRVSPITLPTNPTGATVATLIPLSTGAIAGKGTGPSGSSHLLVFKRTSSAKDGWSVSDVTAACLAESGQSYTLD